jgi:heat shock protein HslJ
MLRHLGLLTGLALTISSPAAVVAQDQAPSPEGTDWQLAAYSTDAGMTAPPDGLDPTLLLLDTVASGNAGCNQFSGSYVLDGASLSVAPEMAQTMMACDPAAQAVEDAYLALLPTTAMWQSADETLQLLDADGAVILEFVQAQPDIATVVALLEELRAEVRDLRLRVDTLEADPDPDGDTDSPTTEATAPTAPRARQSVETVFPDWMRDGLPPGQVANKNREIVRWRDRADDEAGYYVYASRGYCQLRPGTDPQQDLDEADFELARTTAERVDRLPADSTRYRPDHQAIDDSLPEAPDSPYSNDQFYDLYVSAFNDAGESGQVLVGSFFLTPEFRCP